MCRYQDYLMNFADIQAGNEPEKRVDKGWALTKLPNLSPDSSLHAEALGISLSYSKPLTLFLLGVFCKEAIGYAHGRSVIQALVCAHYWGAYQQEDDRAQLADMLASLKVELEERQAGRDKLQPYHHTAALLALKMSEIATRTPGRNLLDGAEVAKAFQLYTQCLTEFRIFHRRLERGELTLSRGKPWLSYREPGFLRQAWTSIHNRFVGFWLGFRPPEQELEMQVTAELRGFARQLVLNAATSA